MSFILYLIVLAAIAFTVAHFTTLGKKTAKRNLGHGNNNVNVAMTRETTHERFEKYLPDGTAYVHERLIVKDTMQLPNGSIPISLPQYQQACYLPDTER